MQGEGGKGKAEGNMCLGEAVGFKIRGKEARGIPETREGRGRWGRGLEGEGMGTGRLSEGLREDLRERKREKE